ncbi:MAG: hypothetical protein ACPL0A_03285 [Candidatus Micrarchaeia archaeon]
MAKLDIVPVKVLTDEEKKIVKKYEKIDDIITLNYSKIVKNARYWRSYNYQGGTHGLSYGDEVLAAQKFLNEINEVFKYSSKEKLKEDSKYGAETIEKVKEFQTYLNDFLGKSKYGVFVDICEEEKRLVNRIIREFKAKNIDLYTDTKVKKWSGKNFDYELKMYDYIGEDGRRGGYLKVFSKDGKHLKTITFSIGRKGDVKFSEDCVMLREILVDGYIGIETRRAAKLLVDNVLVDNVLPKKKELPSVAVPTKTEEIIRIGISTKKYILDNYEPILRFLETPDFTPHGSKDATPHGSKEADKDKEIESLIERVHNIFLSLNYEEQYKLMREGLPNISVKGIFGITTSEYPATWYGMKEAYLDDKLSYKEFLTKWLDLLENNEVTKEAYKRSNGGKKAVYDQSLMNTFISLGNGGVVQKGTGVDVTQITELLDVCRKNITEWYGEKDGKVVLNYLDSVRERIDSKLKENKDVIKSLNSDEALVFDINRMLDLYSNIPGINNLNNVKSVKFVTTTSAEDFIREKLKAIVEKQQAEQYYNEIKDYISNPKNIKFSGIIELEYNNMPKHLKAIAGLLVIEADRDMQLRKKNKEKELTAKY